MNTYRNQLCADEARIDQDSPIVPEVMAMSERAGRFSALAHHYAGVADFEAAQRQRLGRDPKALIAIFTGQVGGPSAADFAILLQELHVYLRLHPELEDADFHVEHAAAEMQAAADREALRLEEDLDAPAAARSDAAYDRRKDSLPPDGVQEEWRDRWQGRDDSPMIGRSDFLPEVVKA